MTSCNKFLIKYKKLHTHTYQRVFQTKDVKEELDSLLLTAKSNFGAFVLAENEIVLNILWQTGYGQVDYMLDLPPCSLG